MALTWTNDLSCGVEEVDEQHRAIFESMNRLEALLDAGEWHTPAVGELVASIVLHTRSHFAFEEHCMNSHRCPVAKSNAMAHQVFLDKLERFQLKVERDGLTEHLIRDLHRTAEGWLLGHICHTDSHLRACAVKPLS